MTVPDGEKAKKMISVFGANAKVGVNESIAVWFLKTIVLWATITPFDIIWQKHLATFRSDVEMEMLRGKPICGLWRIRTVLIENKQLCLGVLWCHDNRIHSIISLQFFGSTFRFQRCNLQMSEHN
jgi:hypothetical protein